jgi:RNA polymerase sigma-70 factor (ECF subfamily)
VELEDGHGDPLAPVQELRVEVGQALEAFRHLTDDQRELFVLVAVEGFSYREAARVLSLPEGTVMSRMARAREALLAAIEGDARNRVRRIK